MVFYPQNLHTHGLFGDGRNDYEDTVRKAIELGFSSIGFSEHSHTPFDESYCMSTENTIRYRELIGKLKAKYNGVIDVLCGVEFDVFSDDDGEAYDYVIGDAHYIKTGSTYSEIDPASPDDLKNTIDTYFGGNALDFAKEYYATMAGLVNLKKCDIAGHFDLVTKHCDSGRFFDTSSPIYRGYALESVTAVAEKIKVFEINVGSIARGYRKTPYPEPFILKRIKELGCGVVISSDCHNKDFLNTNFDLGINLAKECGFDEVLVLTKDGFDGIKI